MTVIDEVAALDALRKTVEKYGSDHKVSKCAYTQPEDGWDEYENLTLEERRVAEPAEPCCILGYALHDQFNVPLQTLKLMDSSEFYSYYSPYASDGIVSQKTLKVLSEYGIEIDAVALDVFEVAQKVQDNGQEWGYALAKAEAYAELLKTGGEENDGTEGAGATA